MSQGQNKDLLEEYISTRAGTQGGPDIDISFLLGLLQLAKVSEGQFLKLFHFPFCQGGEEGIFL